MFSYSGSAAFFLRGYCSGDNTSISFMHMCKNNTVIMSRSSIFGAVKPPTFHQDTDVTIIPSFDN